MSQNEFANVDQTICVCLRTWLQMHSCIPLKSHPPENLIDWLMHHGHIKSLSQSMSQIFANVIKQCVWILRTCLQMHSCIPLKSHPPEQI